MPLQVHEHFVELLDRYDVRCRAGSYELIDDLVSEIDDAYRDLLTTELIAIQLEYRRRDGVEFEAKELLKQFSDLSENTRRKVVQLIEEAGCTRINATPRALYSPSKLPVGYRFGDFEIREKIGQGGMGIVYAARQLSLDRDVAIKVLPADRMTEEGVERFHREAKAAAQLHHTNIVSVYADGCRDGMNYFAMELIDGPSLSEIISYLANNDDVGNQADQHLIRECGLIPGKGNQEYFDDIAKLFAGVAEALDYTHSRGVIHRDIKPANLVLGQDRRLKITDFGLARLDDQPSLTMSGDYMGTPQYMSPEQIAGSEAAVDSATDIYSCGATFYEMLTLEPPVSGHRAKVIAKILTTDPKPPRQINKQIPRDLETICMKAMERVPAHRYQSAGDFAKDLRRYIDRFEIQAKRTSSFRKTCLFIQRNWRAVAVVAAIACLLCVVLGLLVSARANRRDMLISQIIDPAFPIETVPALAEQLCSYPEGVGLLQAEMQKASVDSLAKLRCQVGLKASAVAFDEQAERQFVESLSNALFTLDPIHFAVVRKTLGSFDQESTAKYWDFTRPRHSAMKRFRAACLLANLDPTNDKWKNPKLRRFVAQHLIDSAPDEAGLWARELSSQGSIWLAEAITDSFTNGCAAHRSQAIVVGEHTLPTVHAILRSQHEQFAAIAHKDVDRYVRRVREIKDAPQNQAHLAALRPYPAARVAAAAVLLAKLGEWDSVWQALSVENLLGDASDLRIRSYVIRFLVLNDVEPMALMDHFHEESREDVKASILMGLGSFEKGVISKEQKNEFVSALRNAFVDARAAELHSAAAWLLRKWKCRFPTLETQEKNTGRNWSINSEGQTHVQFEPATFRMGLYFDPEIHDTKGNATVHLRHIDRRFSISACEVTWGEFQRFCIDKGINFRMPTGHAHWKGERIPVAGVSWSLATRYCNWLSQREGIPSDQWCYSEDGTHAKKDFVHLTGYRLPTEAEWEYSCRAGSTTPRFFGEEENWVQYYACMAANSAGYAAPVGSFMPNAFGVFDMYGNVEEWCHDPFTAQYIDAISNIIDSDQMVRVSDSVVSQALADTISTDRPRTRVVRGGHFGHQPVFFRSGRRSHAPPENSSGHRGFRTARTISSPSSAGKQALSLQK